MFFKHFYEPDLAQGSYLVGCQKTGEALVVDARRDIEVYLDAAKAEGLKITHVSETHIHADYLSGSRELAAATGATLYLSDEGNEDWKYGFEGTPFTKVYDGDVITLGNISVKVLHTPGHTPEHISFLITDGAQTEHPGYLLTGDFVFVGDIGRPDLLDEAAGGQGTRFVGAKQLFNSLKNVFLTLPDYVQVWPAHGSGSACGKSLGAVPSTTVGYEKQVAWWAPYLKNNDEKGFVDDLLSGQPDAPLYFGRMKRQNKAGPALLPADTSLTEHKPAELAARINQDLIFVDTRDTQTFINAGVAKSLNVPFGKSFATFASYLINPEKDDRTIVVLAADEEQAKAMQDRLHYIGVDQMKGYVTSLEGLPTHAVKAMTPEELAQQKQSDNAPYILDVRTKNEYREGHIPGSHQLHAGRVMWHLDTLPKDTPLVTLCLSGMRNAAISSALRAAGFDNLIELTGSYQGWAEKVGDIELGDHKSGDAEEGNAS